MHHYRIVWEHEEKNREVEILVDYTLVEGVVAVQAVRPTKVSFYDAATSALAGEVKVWTAAGRQLLASQDEASREGQPSLEDEIYAQLAERDGNLAPV
jgi:hypothetical protein